jgi:dTDP-4-amino-4,6-dideoxygalactose transaminase
MPIAEDISKRILCLPLYWKLENNIVQRVIDIIKNTLQS